MLTAAPAGPAEVDTSPLRVVIDALTPSYLPRRGDLTVRGTVTNRSDETWTTVNLYAFLGDDLEPLRNPGQLAAAMSTPYDTYVGSRVTTQGRPGKVETLTPGQSAPFEITVPVDAFEVTGGGVYWFGVHAIGQSASSPRDQMADGRARTFLPYVPARVGTPERVALVLPLLRSVPRRADGSVDQEARWTRALSPGGRLRDLLGFVAGSGPDAPISWLVDPALIDAVGTLADGNLPRTLATASGSESEASAAPTGAPTSPESSPTPAPSAATRAASRAAAAWIDALPAAFSGNEVLSVPYGNVDVPAAQRSAPELLALALAQRSTVLEELEISTPPVLTAPGGYLDAESIAAAGRGSRVLVSDDLLTGATPGVGELGGQRLVVSSTGAAEGSPGPGPALSAVGLRQRILAEAAVRAIKADQEPLTVVLPTEWALDSAAEFFGGLDVDWLRLQTLSNLQAQTQPETISTDQVDYPELEERRELAPATFEAAKSLISAGDTLQRVLVGNNTVAGALTEEALTRLSYAARKNQVAARESLAQSQAWVDEQLQQVRITASSGVTLSSDSGSFLVSLSNDLDHTVAVRVDSVTDADITITPSQVVELAPGARTNVLLETRAVGNRVHNVTLLVTDADLVPLGASDQLPIRSAQVSAVIWLIMGIGVGLLFLAIIVRLVRRIRTARRAGKAAHGDTGGHPAADRVTT